MDANLQRHSIMAQHLSPAWALTFSVRLEAHIFHADRWPAHSVRRRLDIKFQITQHRHIFCAQALQPLCIQLGLRLEPGRKVQQVRVYLR